MKKVFTVLIAFTTTILSAQNASWQEYYPNASASGLAARGNTILVATFFGFTRFDTLGNATFYDAVNSGLPFNSTEKVAVDYADNWWVVHVGGVAKYESRN